MRDTNFKYRPISDVQQQNNPDENGEISNQATEPTPDQRKISARADVAALHEPVVRTSALFEWQGRMIALNRIFSIIGVRSYLV